MAGASGRSVVTTVPGLVGRGRAWGGAWLAPRGPGCEPFVPQPNRRVLVVDDTPAIHEDFRKILGEDPGEGDLDDLEAELFGTQAQAGRQGFEIDSAYQGREALEKVRASLGVGRPYAVAFVDMRMPPGWDGVETIERLWECDPALQVVICTAYSDHSWDEVLERLEVTDRLLILKKPFDPIEVYQLANTLTAKWQRTLEAGVERSVLERLVNERTAALGAVNVELRRELEERARTEAELRLSASVFQHTTDGIVIVDARGRVVSLNPAFVSVSGYAPGEILGRPIGLLRRSLPGAGTYRALRDSLEEKGCWEGEMWNRRKNGEDFLARVSVSRVAGAADAPGVERAERYVIVCNDVTELRRKDERIRHLAFHDQLTHLPNRVLLTERLEQRVTLASRLADRLGVMVIDLDRFKAVNDSYGHEVGNNLLRAISRRLRECLRDSDTVARVGGDEFVLLSRTSAPEDCAALARQIITRLSEPVTVDGHLVRVGASVGIACYPEDGRDAGELMTHAGAAMYSAKESGRGTFRFFRAEMTARAEERLRLELELRAAVERGELELFYQPKVSLVDGTLLGAEALARWRHPRRGLVEPLEFIPLAEETGIICDLGTWVLGEACRQVGEWRRVHGTGMRVAVNISAIQVQRGDLVGDLLRLCDEHGVSPADLEVELTESVIMDNLDAVAPMFTRLRDMGTTVAVDDFGMGYSSFAYLRDLPLDVLKIDRSFVAHAGGNVADREIVRTIVALGQALDLDVVAEGVETRDQADLLTSFGCRTAQGYLFARPLPPQEFSRWFLSRSRALRGGPGAPPESC